MRWLPILRGHALYWHGETMAALISLQTLKDALHVLGYPAVTLFIMVESSGIPFPGETMLLLASFASATFDPQLQLPIIIVCAALGAILGDNLGFYVGRTGGRAFVEKFGRYFFIKSSHLDFAEKFFVKHGDKTVFFGRFFSILRTWSAFLAGVNHMRWRTFLVYNAAGGIVWAIVYGLIGYFAGHFFQNNFAQVESVASTSSWIGAAIIAVVAIIIYIIFRIRRARRLRTTAPAKNTNQ
jgi:membrane protein DedA with SNARE-associated domain